MIGSFAQIDKFAAALNYPYFIWLLFALWLNISFVWLNGAKAWKFKRFFRNFIWTNQELCINLARLKQAKFIGK